MTIPAVGDLDNCLGDAYLKVKWTVADVDVFGVYACGAVGIDKVLGFVVENSLELSIWEQNITAQALLDLIDGERH